MHWNFKSHYIPPRHVPFQEFFPVPGVTRFVPHPPAAIEELSDLTASVVTGCLASVGHYTTMTTPQSVYCHYLDNTITGNHTTFF